MSKLLLLLVAVLVFFWLLRRALTGRKPGAGAAATKAPAPELVACAHCGVLLPKDEAFFSDDAGQSAEPRLFCTEEHLRQGPR